jgi:hypothetical protein
MEDVDVMWMADSFNPHMYEIETFGVDYYTTGDGGTWYRENPYGWSGDRVVISVPPEVGIWRSVI